MTRTTQKRPDPSNTALRMAERSLRTFLDNLPDCVARFDRDCRHQFVNPAVEEIYGIPAGDLIGRRVRKRIRSHIQ